MIFLKTSLNSSHKGREFHIATITTPPSRCLVKTGSRDVSYSSWRPSAVRFIEAIYSPCSPFLCECGKCKHQSSDLGIEGLEEWGGAAGGVVCADREKNEPLHHNDVGDVSSLKTCTWCACVCATAAVQ